MNSNSSENLPMAVKTSTLQKLSEGYALIIDQPVLDLLGLEERGEVQLTIENGSLVVTPVNPRSIDRERFAELLDQLVERRREVLQRLAQ